MKHISPKKVSVIIPMYNAEAFIGSCLLSVRNQTYRQLEILVIDDGSTDQGPLICQEMSRQDERICLYRQENTGVSGARNRGLFMASGEYVFFLDSDDAIHPFLLQELVRQAEERSAELAFCGCEKLDSREFERALKETPEYGSALRWEMAEKEEAENWFHISHVRELTGIGGKLIQRAFVGELRFDEGLSNGEDTLFLYHLVSGQLRMVWLREKWYYYRMHAQSATHRKAKLNEQAYFEGMRQIRDQEYRRGHLDYAVTWENNIVWQIANQYKTLRKLKDKDGCEQLEKAAALERKSPLFGHLHYSMRFLFRSCFCCYPLYVLLDGAVSLLLKIKE